jgi:hypothetical protein
MDISLTREYLQFIAIISLIVAVVIPVSGMLESELMKGEDYL